MKYIYTLIFLVCMSSFITNAQPIITQANYPVVGDSYSGVLDFTAAFTPGPAGPSQTWDFSALSASPVSTFNYVAPSATAYSATFSTSDIALNPFIGQYLYFLSSPTKFEISGTVTGFGSPFIRPYNDPQKIITFPFTYTNSFKDTAQTPNYAGGTGKYQRRILYSETIADGHGTLMLPGATYTNALRIRVTSKTIDSSFTTAGNVFQAEDIYIDTNYYWVSSGYKPHLLWLSKNIDLGTTNETIFAQYFTTPAWPTGIKDQFNSNIAVYPNPVASDLTVEIDQNILKSNPNITFCLVNSTGHEVIPCKNIQSDKVNISGENISSGIYFYKIVSEGKILSAGKISIQ